MRLSSEALIALTLFFGTAQTQSGYQSTCNPPPSGEVELEPGLFATYTCGQVNLPAGHTKEPSIPASDPTECAKACSKRAASGPCSWTGNKCWNYHPGTGTVARSNSVSIDIREDWKKLKEAYNACQAAKNGLQGDLDDCLAGSGGGGPPGPDDKPAPIAATGGNCPGDGTIVSHNGKDYKAFCGHGWGSGPNLITPRIFVNTFAECFDYCSQSPQCKQVLYYPKGWDPSGAGKDKTHQCDRFQRTAVTGHIPRGGNERTWFEQI